MTKLKYLFLISVIPILSACQNPKMLSDEEKTAYLKSGDSITTEMQAVLLQNVSAAIQKGGTEYAVDFCNLEAMTLTDSISKMHDVGIQRLTDKTRNPKNAIVEEMDQLAWERIKSEDQGFLQQDENGEVYFYKPIKIGMPACIRCHGKKSEISSTTLEMIQLKYPADRAVDYEQGDLRGMWKVKM